VKVDLYVIYLVYAILITFQYLVVPRINLGFSRRQTPVVILEVVVIFYCAWVGASDNPAYEKSGLFLLILSGILFWRNLK